jgi:hypothetical protein
MLGIFKKMLSVFFPISPCSNEGVRESIILAAENVRKTLNENGTSLTNICISIEEAKNKNDLKVAFDDFNDVMSMISLIAPLTEQSGIICQVLSELEFSKKFSFYLNTATTPHEAIFAYKRAVVNEFAKRYRQIENFLHEQNSFEDAIFQQYLPSTFKPSSQVKGTVKGKLTDLCDSLLSPEKEQSFTNFTEGGPARNSRTTHATFMESSKVKGMVQGNLTDRRDSVLSLRRKRSFSNCTQAGSIDSTEISPARKSSTTQMEYEKYSFPGSKRRCVSSGYEGQRSKFE